MIKNLTIIQFRIQKVNFIINSENVEEHGVWQVIVGRQFVASVTFDARYLVYFVFEEISKYFLVFRS